jgi:GntR family transcriptional regulator
VEQAGGRLGVRVYTGSPVPIYAQIMDQIKMAVATGVVARGTLLPSVRALASQLGINPNTVARAYSELESEGLIESGQGRGTFVSSNPPRVAPGGVDRALDAAVAAGLAAGLDPRALRERFEAAVERVSGQPAGQSRRK